MRVLVLWTYDSPSTRRICAAVREQAPEMGLTPVFLQCRDAAVVAAEAATAGYRVMALDDPAVSVAARLSPRMERPLLDGDPEAVADKWGQRRTCADHGLPCPPFALVETVADVTNFGKQWGYPLILKPARGTESRGVRQVDGPDDIGTALAASQRAAVDMGWDKVLAEGYLDGPDVAVESIVLDGLTHHISVAQSGWHGPCWRAATPMEPALERHRDAIGAAVAAVNMAFGVRWAATSHEVRLTAHGPVLVEANVRLGGGACEETIRRHCGVDRVQVILQMLAGLTPSLRLVPPCPVVQAAIRATERGRVRTVEVPRRLLGDPLLQLWVDMTAGTLIEDPTARMVAWLLIEGKPGEHAGHLLPRASAYARDIRVVTEPA